MTQTIVSVALFLVLLGCLPMAIKWVQRRSMGGLASASAVSKIVSAVAVGPHLRVVTVEVGPEGARTWLVLGVTTQSITCLHSMAAESHLDKSRMPLAQHTPSQL
jgi:flagellar protein FliO/FliZ